MKTTIKKEQSHHSTTLSSKNKINKKQPFRKSIEVKLLEIMVFKDKRKKYPTIPIDYLSPVTFRDDTANGLMKCIIAFLELKYHQEDRIISAGRAIEMTPTFKEVIGPSCIISQIEWITGPITKGSADMCLTIAGDSVKIEVKISHDNKGQVWKDCEGAIISGGSLYFLALDFNSFLAWYNLNFYDHG